MQNAKLSEKYFTLDNNSTTLFAFILISKLNRQKIITKQFRWSLQAKKKLNIDYFFVLWIIVKNNDVNNVNNDFRGNVIAIRNVSKKIIDVGCPINSTTKTSTQKNPVISWRVPQLLRGKHINRSLIKLCPFETYDELFFRYKTT